MKELKDLTPAECVTIASIAEPNVTWEFVQSKNKWNGFDLIEAGSEGDISKFIFQIDYSNEELKGKSRFRIYENLHDYHIDYEKEVKIYEYLKSL